MTAKRDTPVSVTAHALEAITKYAIVNQPREVCGFIVGHNGVGARVIAVMNVMPEADQPTAYEMAHQGILGAYKEVDETGEEVIAVFHSHTASPPIMSARDMAVRDQDPAQIIISTMDPEMPKARAYRLDMEFLGMPRVTEVMLHISTDGLPYAPSIPDGPWAFMPGNVVKIQYTSTGYMEKKITTATIKRSTPDTIWLEKANGSIRSMELPMARVHAVEIVEESPAATRSRRLAAMHARQVGVLIAAGSVESVGEILASLAVMFPVGIEHYDDIKDAND